MCVNGPEPLPADVGETAEGGGRGAPVRRELERLLGRDLAQMLLAALAPGQALRGASSP